ncbi:magnesium chelatase subunit D [Rhodovulum adriaticum]|uniref:Mg-protoporphyrin IX chelatase n=1 Tax=Rhodovulum adriaticum TaxID=35804 RepID=A0A4V2SMK8_RHOAD|nr:magnesium chelatase subunit D [Rhodovulum adriaticum]MBK1636758.1 magnesium chelatase ATPase subunit D [Rhodovulum adriaticum]TCP27686.1 protoporphyrin IX magnesium-chelatase [Rhodovulum adriaticum]
MSTTGSVWTRVEVGLNALAVDPAGLGGLWLRARSGPVRDRVVAALPGLPLPQKRLHPSIGDEQLFGGIDLTATLASGRVVERKGILADPAVLVLPMAERSQPGLAARLAGALDQGTGHCLIAMDEGAEPDETLPPALTDRLALHVDLDALPYGETDLIELDEEALAQARARLPQITAAPKVLEDLTLLAVRLGIDSLRAPMLALRTARALAAIGGGTEVDVDDLTTAVELVLGPRATQFPQEEQEQDQPPEPPQPEPEEPEQDQDDPGEGQSLDDLPLQDILLEAAQAALPADLLAQLAARKSGRGAMGGAGAGAKLKGNRRGRPIPSRRGRLDTGNRLDVIATLRAAAPWQTIRRQEARIERRLHIRTDDFRIRRFEEKSDRLLIFVVDASGSAAMTRLAEAKGAVELLLAEAYARRDHVALVAFRGEEAELLLPPTRSLVQTKRRLAALPGGGGTPLAAGLKTALEVAIQAKGRGMTPTVALLTDGRANIALDGTPNRALAAEDATKMATAIRLNDFPSMVIDMGQRPERSLRALADTLGGPYIPLPRADADRLSSAVSAALDV